MAKLTPIPFAEIASSALSSADSLLRHWLPDGKVQSGEYKATNPLRADKAIGSFSINLRSGKWGDFATNDAGNDLISLYAYLFGLEQWKAAIEVADQIGFRLPDGCRPATDKPTERKAPVIDPATIKQSKPKEESPWHPVMPVPAGAPDAPKAHVKRGLPAEVYPYKGAEGVLLGYVYRFVTSDGGKETLPLVWAKNADTGAEEWRWMQWPEGKRPLYGLDRLQAKPDAWVLLVEGEKCADAPLNILDKPAIISWPGGSKAVDKVDWSPLAGKRIYAWPDCDAQREKTSKAEIEAGVDPASKPLLPEHEQPGVAAMLKIKAKLLEIDPNTQFKMVDIPAPNQVKSGWDIADAIADGWDLARLREFITKTREYALVDASLDTPADNQQGKILPFKKKQSTPKSAKAEGEENTWIGSLLRKPNGDWLDCRENMFSIISNDDELVGLIEYDEFALRIVKTRPAPWDVPFEGTKQWQDEDTLELGFWVASKYGFVVRAKDNINDAVKLTAKRNAHDPLIEYLDGLVWDKVPRANFWLNAYVGAEYNDYTAIAGSRFLIGLIARAYRPGCIMRTMLVLEGQQFRGKSTIARILAGKWFSDSPIDLKGKDGFINIQGVWLQEIAEMGSFNNQEAPIIKAYLSSASDRFRSPFDTYAKDYPRRTVFFGTTNEDVYLRDKTGNTRFWPIKAEAESSIDLEALERDRDQLLAEAVHRFKAGEPWHLSEKEQQDFFTIEQQMREYDDPWEDRISKWLNSNTFVTTSVSEVLDDCLKIEAGKQTQFNAIQVGKILNRLGWKQSRPDAKNGKRQRVYTRPEIHHAEVQQAKGLDDEIAF